MIVLALLAACALGQTAGENPAETSDAGASADAPAETAPSPAPPPPAPATRPGYVRPPGVPSWIPDSALDDDPFLKEPVPLSQFIPATAGGGSILVGIGFYLYAHYLEEKIRSGDPTITTDAQLVEAIGWGQVHEAIGLSLIGIGSVGLGYAFYLRYFVPREPPPVWKPRSRNKPKPKAELRLLPVRGGAVAGFWMEWP